MISRFVNYLGKAYKKNNWFNKYSLTLIVFAVWLSFFDTNNIFTQVKLSQTIHSLKNDKSMYESQLEVALQEKKNLEENTEKFAREKYLFHKDNEEVIVIKK